jgi:hypothetical protein
MNVTKIKGSLCDYANAPKKKKREKSRGSLNSRQARQSDSQLPRSAFKIDRRLLKCCAVMTGKYLPTFLKNRSEHLQSIAA